ncbi:hypothetical protein SELMODRAFT_2225, partial [Selaginella moellendorffii]
GLVNLGNTCFFNSVMQNLLAVRYLKDYFLNPVAAGASEGPLTSALRRFFLEINGDNLEAFSGNAKKRHRDYTTYNPKGLFGALCSKSSRFSGYHQQDSHELLRCLLDGLQVEGKHKESEEKNSANGKEDHTFVDHLFGGQFASTVTCCECGHSSSVLEPFLDVSLPIPFITAKSLEGCLQAFTKLEVLSGENAWGCDNCTRRKATKRLVIRKAPPVLTVHLKRFAQDMRGRLSKLTGHVAFDELLNLSPFLSTSRDGGLYRLVGVVEHSGTMKGGHYVAFVRGGSAGDGKENFWYYISDSDVRRTTLDQVLRSEAYLLFY